MPNAITAETVARAFVAGDIDEIDREVVREVLALLDMCRMAVRLGGER